MRLSAELALAISIILRELFTNAAKFGALSNPSGRVAVIWRLQRSQHLQLIQSESGEPEVRPPSRRGFGSRLIERGLSAELGGTAGIRFQPTGVVCAANALLGRHDYAPIGRLAPHAAVRPRRRGMARHLQSGTCPVSPRPEPNIEQHQMRAEIEQASDTAKQSIGLLRRHL